MKYWTDVYKIAEQALCLSCIDSIYDFLNEPGISKIKITVKKEVKNGQVMCGYATLEIGIDEKRFEYKFLVSWGDKKFEEINFWITTAREKYITCHNDKFLSSLYDFNSKMNNTWEHLSKWIVHNTDYKELIIDRNSDLKDCVLGEYFNKDFEYTQLNILLDEEKFKDKVKKI